MKIRRGIKQPGIMRGRGSADNCLMWLLIICLYYFSYRYIFKYANTMTSPTYFDTPRAIQTAKYVICAGLLLPVFLTGIRRRNIIHKGTGKILLLIYLILQGMYSFVWIHSANCLILRLGLLTAFCICVAQPEFDYDSIDRIFYVYLIFCMVYEGIQIFLFFTKGRLPAIAHDTGSLTDVRFGGPIDDPLGFSLLLSFLIPYLFHRFEGLKRDLYCAVFVLFLLLTWTLTAIAALSGVYAAALFFRFLRKRKAKANYILLFLLLFLAALLFTGMYGQTFAESLYRTKISSIREHLAAFYISDLPIPAFLGLRPEPKVVESAVIRLLYNGGFLYAASFYTLGIYSAVIMHRMIRNVPESEKKRLPVYYGMFYYQICFMIASINLPYIHMFLNIMMYSLFLGMAFVHSRSYSSQAGERERF